MKSNFLNKFIFFFCFFIFGIYFVYADTTTYMSCGNQNGIPYDLPGFIRNLILIIKIVIPILIIIMGSVDYLKVVFGNSKDDLSKAIKKFVTRLLAGVCVFFLITLIQLFVNMLGNDNDGLLACISCFVSDGSKCSTYEVENVDYTDEKNQAEKEREELEAKREEIRKKNEEEANKIKQEDGINTSSTVIGTKTIYIGDSRTVGMCASLSGDWKNCQFSNGWAYKYNSNEIFIAQGSMGYSWFEKTAIPAVNKILASDSNTTYNIVSYMGVNYLLSDVDKYVVKYKELSNGAWKNHNIILASVNPVDEAKERQNGYATKQANIVTFNSKIKSVANSLSNAYYCDTYNSILNNFSTTDGLHYSSDTYKKIYNLTKTCISKSGVNSNVNAMTGKGYGKATSISIKYGVKDSEGRCGSGKNDYCAAVATVKYQQKTVTYYLGYQNNSGLLSGSCRSHAFMSVVNAVNGTKYSTLDLQKYLYSTGDKGVLMAEQIPKALKKYNLTAKAYYEETSISESAKLMKTALDNGQPVMIFVAHSKCSDIAGSHHALLLLGYDDNGDVIFIDSVPYSKKAKKRNIEELSKCLSGGSIPKNYYRMIIFSFK